MKGFLLGALFLAACDSELPEPPPGGRITGTVRYVGDAHRDLHRPGLQVAAFATFPPSGPPHAIAVLEPDDGDLTAVPYELANLAPFDGYRVFARVAELEDPTGGPMDLPLGGYPSFCALTRPEGRVTVTVDGPTAGIDIDVYDDGGLDDPCNVPTDDVCPQPGFATLNVEIRSTRTATDADALLVALFDVFPSMSPAIAFLIPGGEVSFPEIVRHNAVPPASYPAFYTCLDVGMNNLASLCGSEDAFVLRTDPIDFPADQIVSLTADLDAGSLAVSVDPPATFGCGP